MREDGSTRQYAKDAGSDQYLAQARISRFATSDPFGPQCGARIANYIIKLLADT